MEKFEAIVCYPRLFRYSWINFYHVCMRIFWWPWKPAVPDFVGYNFHMKNFAVQAVVMFMFLCLATLWWAKLQRCKIL